MKVYEWHESRSFPVTAQVAGKRIEFLAKGKPGPVEARDVVADARSNNSPLHSCFEWNNKVAGTLHREEQARLLIRCLRVVVKTRKAKDSKPTRAFVRVVQPVDEEDRSGYMAMDDAMSDPVLREQVLNRAYNELRSWRKRYADIKELAEFHAAIDSMAA